MYLVYIQFHCLCSVFAFVCLVFNYIVRFYCLVCVTLVDFMSTLTITFSFSIKLLVHYCLKGFEYNRLH